MDDVVDLAVVGAGPAGSAAALRALQLRPEARVLLVDAAEFPRDKTCGDGIAAHALDLVEALGVPGVSRLGPPVPRMRLRSPGGQVVERTCARPNRVVPRTVFDAELVAAAVARGARLLRHRVRRLEVRPDRVVLDGAVAARVVVGADGANSTVRRMLGAPVAPPSATAVAVRGYAPTAVDPDTLVIEFARGSYPAYAWSFPLPGGGANVGFGVFDKRGSGSRAELVAALRALLPGHEPDPASVRGHHLPLSTTPRHHPDGRVLLAGDAAALVNPLTGEGIFDALASGVLAGRAALLGAAAGAAHRAAMRRTFGRHHAHGAVLSRLLHRPRFLDAAVLAAARRQSVFDSAVDLGLGCGTASLSSLAHVALSYATAGS
ncbi:NAD(P)/FAD-dependent oxidoreductase [Pseudonocardia cypriaca]|uniref:Geranylgeranyl reductase family protein n=1 Tax=Pseudonocardia cypriaca TaxID=882449 RepID=A0A543GHR4_9PSEU|nr:NAD(P)/FAD-dependent oxidoreductase [Pseudonocardia cypriaca]TQM45621.1 geranylgeranyl reductase family protein [Pseudonocardia cypriaca]